MTLLDDILFEYTEDFDLELRFDPFLDQPPSGVILRPNVSTICILDDDGNDYSQSIHIPYLDNMQYIEVIIGFINPPYYVIENEGQVAIQIGVIDGSLQREVVVSFSTSDDTAVGKLDLIMNITVILLFILLQMETITIALQIYCLPLTLSLPLLMFQSLSLMTLSLNLQSISVHLFLFPELQFPE